MINWNLVLLCENDASYDKQHMRKQQDKATKNQILFRDRTVKLHSFFCEGFKTLFDPGVNTRFLLNQIALNTEI